MTLKCASMKGQNGLDSQIVSQKIKAKSILTFLYSQGRLILGNSFVFAGMRMPCLLRKSCSMPRLVLQIKV